VGINDQKILLYTFRQLLSDTVSPLIHTNEGAVFNFQEVKRTYKICKEEFLMRIYNSLKVNYFFSILF
jgi:hypothetical protein